MVLPTSASFSFPFLLFLPPSSHLASLTPSLLLFLNFPLLASLLSSLKCHCFSVWWQLSSFLSSPWPSLTWLCLPSPQGSIPSDRESTAGKVGSPEAAGFPKVGPPGKSYLPVLQNNPRECQECPCVPSPQSMVQTAEYHPLGDLVTYSPGLFPRQSFL